LHTVLRLAAALESLSSHPIASAFLEHADGHGLEFERCKVEGFKLLEGEGVTGIVDGFRVHVGSEALARRVVAEDEQAWPCRVRLRRARREALEASAAAHDAVELQMPARMQRATRRASEEAAARLEDAVAAAEAEAAAEAAAAGEVEDAAESCATALRPLAGRAPTASTSCLGGACLGLDDATPLAWSRAGSSVLWVLVGSEVVAACELSDAVRTEAAVAVAALGALGVEPIMLTGDCEAKAQAVRAAVGINAARSGMKPATKLEAIRELRRRGVVGMIGDGINDGPALAAADVGIAMGISGSGLASHAAGVVLMSNDLRRVSDAIAAARRVTRTLLAGVSAALALKIVPLVLMFAAPHGTAEEFLIAVAVGSDVLGIAIVLGAATTLLHLPSRFASTPCGGTDVMLTVTGV